ncbi:MAG: M23 family metallopeptidase [Gammaproteobacteria bacterium]|nr:M23 family metallopeptidase [Gammaproteobacteria bacterium]
MNTNITGYDLPLTPPMDLNSSMRDIDVISPFPMQLRTRNNVGLFSARRNATPRGGHDDDWLIRQHFGIDLLAPIGTKVFASASGKVVLSNTDSITILHDYGLKFITNYFHLQNVVVAANESVSAGQLISEVNNHPDWPEETHLHFEVRLPFDSVENHYAHSLPVNPTFAMYHWEIKNYKNKDGVDRSVIDDTHIVSFEEIVRSRQLRFVMIKVENNDGRPLYLPIQTGLVEDASLAETIRQAFMTNKRVRLVWRESLFFSKIQSDYEKVAIVAEVKVYR